MDFYPELSDMTELDTSLETDISKTMQAAMNWFRTEFMKEFSNRELDEKAFTKIVENNKQFGVNFFALLDSDENGSVCLQEFAGGLCRLARGRKLPDTKITELIQLYLEQAETIDNLKLEDFMLLCSTAKFSKRLFGLFDLDDSGKVDATEFVMGLDKLRRSNTGIKWYTWAENWFSKHASTSGHITKQQFLEYLNISKSFFSERLFEVVDSDGSGTVDVTELMKTMHILTQGSAKERLLLVFSVYDIDGSGSLTYEEIRTVLEWCLSDSSLPRRNEIVEKLTKVLFEQLDVDNSGDITLAEFEIFLNQYPNITNNLSIGFSQWIRPSPKKWFVSTAKLQRKITRTSNFMRNNKPLIAYWIVYAAVNITLFMTAAAKYWDNQNIFVVLARGPGQCLNFNSAFIVVLMFRHLLTYIRSTWLRKYLPLDHSIAAHKVTGIVIAFFSLLHTAMHITNFGILATQTNVTWVEYLFTLQDGLGWVEGSACITGWILIVVLAAIVITSLPCIRRRGYFQLFYWSHWLFIGWWITLVIHAPHFWKWVIGPASIYALEKLWRHVRSRERESTVVRSIRSVDPKVSEVLIERPKRFKFNAGDYIFIKIDDIANFEWHPFTISSAPENTETLSLHIQAVGDWTKRLRELGERWAPKISIPPEINDNKYKIGGGGQQNFAFVDEQPIHTTTLQFQSKSNHKIVLPGFARGSKGDNGVCTLSIRKSTEYPSGTENHLDVESCTSRGDSRRNVKVMIDGPYGSPSTNLYSVDHAILIGAGIGVTPFASILQSIMYRRKRQRAVCPKCSYWWKVQTNDDLIPTPQKVEFVWVTRTFETMEWFLDVLGELEEEQEKFSEDRFLDLNLHVTSALGQSDIRAVALQMALELCYQQEARDPLCGLRTRLQPGRPNWKKMFDRILQNRQGRVCVFYCGPPQLEKILKKLCSEYRLDFRSENF